MSDGFESPFLKNVKIVPPPDGNATEPSPLAIPAESYIKGKNMTGEIARGVTDLKRAIQILNERKHRGYDRWRLHDKVIQGRNQYDALDEFEVIAIAQRYEMIITPSESITFTRS